MSASIPAAMSLYVHSPGRVGELHVQTVLHLRVPVVHRVVYKLPVHFPGTGDQEVRIGGVKGVRGGKNRQRSPAKIVSGIRIRVRFRRLLRRGGRIRVNGRIRLCGFLILCAAHCRRRKRKQKCKQYCHSFLHNHSPFCIQHPQERQASLWCYDIIVYRIFGKITREKLCIFLHRRTRKFRIILQIRMCGWFMGGLCPAPCSF